MRLRAKFAALVVSVAAVALVGASCVVPTPAAAPEWTSVCVPSDWPGAQLSANIVYVPPGGGGWLGYNYLVQWGSPGDPHYDSTTLFFTEADLVAGETRSLAAIDAGLCLSLKPSPGLVYTVSSVPVPHVWGPTHGHPPGSG